MGLTDGEKLEGNLQVFLILSQVMFILIKLGKRESHFLKGDNHRGLSSPCHFPLENYEWEQGGENASGILRLE